MTTKLGLRGYFCVEKLDAAGKPISPSTLTHNAVTYAGAAYMLLTGSNTPRLLGGVSLAIGTGNVEITRTSTALGAEHPGRSVLTGTNDRGDGNEVDNLDGTATLTLKWTASFALGAKVGTFSEVGMYSSASGGTFIAGQLIKDEFGDPTTVTLLADEQLRITYTLEFTYPTVSSKIGEGIATAEDNSTYAYEIWAQPYWSDYTIGATGNNGASAAYNNGFERVGMVLRRPTGNTDLLPRYYQASEWSNWAHLGDGLYRSTSTAHVLPPVVGELANIGFVLLGGLDAARTNLTSGQNIVNPTTALRAANSATCVRAVVKFVDPITKLATDSLKVQITHTVQV